MRSPPESSEFVPPTSLSTDSGRLHISKPLQSVMPVEEGRSSDGKSVVLVMSAVLALFAAAVFLAAGVAAFGFVAWSANRHAQQEAVLRAEAAENLHQLGLALQRAQAADAPADDEETQAARAVLPDTFGVEPEATPAAEESVANSPGN